MSQEFSSNSLVLYKNGPAIVDQPGDKISIQVTGGKTVKVRPKDIKLLHPGPLKSLHELNQEPAGDLEDAWELLQGETVGLAELAEYIYGETTPVTVWHALLALRTEVHFIGPTHEIVARTEAEVERVQLKQREKEQEASRWQEYLERVKDNSILPEDIEYLKEVESFAYGRTSKSRTLKELGIEAIPEKAHQMMLRLGLWNQSVNPYPSRFGCALTQPELDVPELQEEEREDLTALETFAIDDDNCSDPDDAISLDGDSIWVHVADAAALIKADSPLDLEARARGANLYLPETIINMLPAAVTTKLGLGLQEERSPALSFKIGFNEEGQAVCQEMTPSWVKVQRTSYSATDLLMDESPFAEMSVITEAFRKRRFENGAAQLNLPEVKLKTTVGEPLYNLCEKHELGLKSETEYSVEISDLPRLKSRDMVTDAMLMAGEAIALFLNENRIPAPYASQPPPDEASTPVTMAENFAYRKKFKRSGLHLEPDLHAGLGLDQYTRVTSPLRRYSDLLVHQQLRAFLAGEPLISEEDMLKRMSEAESGGGSVSQAERRSNRHWILLHMQQHPETVYRGVVVDKRDDRGVVMIPELGLDARVRQMANDKLDDEVNVQLTKVYLTELDFSCRILRAPKA